MRVALIAVLGAGFLVAGAAAVDAGVAERAVRKGCAPGQSALATRTADEPAPLVRESLRRQPPEPIPVGTFGPFGQSAREAADTAPVAPPSWNLLDLRMDLEPEDNSAPLEAH